MNTKDWKLQLVEILRENNERHGKRDKIVSYLTMHQRGQRLFSCFQQLRNLGYKIENPRNLAPRHIQALVDHWVSQKKAAATIQTWLSHLRVYARWINKPGLVGRPTEYVTDPEFVKRQYAATEDGSWSSHNINIEKLIVAVAEKDRYIGNQLLAELLFGLRVKEAILLRPWRDHQGNVLLVSDGAKGGRPRAVRIVSQEQKQALLIFKKRLRHKDQSLADPGLSLKQAITRYYSVMRSLCINKKHLGVTSHGLRKEYANQQYKLFAGEPSPIQGGDKIDRSKDKEARLEVMEQLGHSREKIGTAYLGAIIRSFKDSKQIK